MRYSSHPGLLSRVPRPVVALGLPRRGQGRDAPKGDSRGPRGRLLRLL